MPICIKPRQCLFCPHLLYPQVLDDNNPEERRLGINIGKEFFNKM